MDGYNCSQAILTTYGPEFGIDRETALRISSPFGAGVGSMGATCGVVNGAFLVIGLKYGWVDVKDKKAKTKTYELVRVFVEEFQSINDSIVCRDLLDCDLSTKKGFAVAVAKKLFKTRCPVFVRDSARILEQIL